MPDFLRVGPSDSLQDAMNVAASNQTIAVAGLHNDVDYNPPRPVRLVNDGGAVLEKIFLEDHASGSKFENIKWERNTPVDSNSHRAVWIHGASKLTFDYCEITGHGYSVGYFFAFTFYNEGTTITGGKVHEIENRGLEVTGDNHIIDGVEVHNLYRTVDQGFFDVDAVNCGGTNLTFRNMDVHDIREGDSISINNTGSSSEPHCDAIQVYTFIRNNEPIPTKNLIIEDCRFRNLSNSSIILESNGSQGAQRLVSGTKIRRNYLECGAHDAALDESNQVIILKGVDDTEITHNTMANLSPLGYKLVHTDDAGGNGALGCQGVVLKNNVGILANSSAVFASDLNKVTGYVEEDNVLMYMTPDTNVTALRKWQGDA